MGLLPKHFPEKLVDAPARRVQHLATKRCNFIDTPPGFPIALQVRAQIALILQPMQDGIKSSSTQFVSMARQLLRDPNSVQRFFGGVMEDVETDQPRI